MLINVQIARGLRFRMKEEKKEIKVNREMTIMIRFKLTLTVIRIS
jgi:hypothetical protein